ncbi:MAG: hypothetical protein ACJARP_002304 [Vicingaceae bacterium]|jgi:hypothetical protein
MNRIVVVGNGYDIFRGLNTKYEHFVIEYLKRVIRIAQKNKSLEYKDRLVRINYGIKAPELSDDFDSIKVIEDLKKIDIIKIKHWSFGELYNPRDELIKLEEEVIILTIESSLFQKIFKDLKWADIEKIYFEELLEVYRSSISSKLELGDRDPSILNQDFELIRNNLVKYLKEISSKLSRDFMIPFELEKLHERLNEPLDSSFITSHFSDYNFEFDKSIDTLKYLNFNYTEQLYIDLQRISTKQPNITHIHGDLGKPDSVIFGFGDNHNKNYTNLKRTDNNDFLKHLKHYRYKTNHELTKFFKLLGEDIYDVVVIGHSLGISDRYILSRIFQHENCKVIRMFSRGGEYKYSDKVSALSLHFDNDDWEDKVAIFDKHDTFK